MNKDRNIRVLIVDDEERFRATTATILKNRGFHVKAVGSGLEAIEEVRKNNIDVVILDVKMPGMDGHEALREIRKIKPDISVIMLTGHGTPESAFEGLKKGVFDYLTKPCSIDLLAQKIRDAFASGKGLKEEESRVRDIMLPLTSFSTIGEERTVADAIDVILQSFIRTMTSTTVQETVHRSILILNRDNKVVGVMTFTDLLQGLQPPYMRLMTERPQMADSIYLEPPNFSGMFTIMARDIASKQVKDVMSDAPPVINADANLMEAVNQLLTLGVRRLLVIDGDDIIGVVREQDIFFEMSRLIRQESI